MNRVGVILAGGGGTRFWPLSRRNMPKQFLNISGNDVMLNDTINRYDTVIPISNTVIVTNKVQAEMLEDILLDSIPHENILKEPAAKNTSACILYASLYIQKKFGPSIMVVLPSDHYITDVASFRNVLGTGCSIAEQYDKIVTIGIKPTFPSTGYGYIRYNRENFDSQDDIYEVEEFVEKPNLENARKYISSGSFLWNSGMYLWKTDVIIEAYRRYLPRLFNVMNKAYDSMCTDKEQQAIDEIYPELQSISIDYGIMERSDNVLVIPGDFGWNDVGSWDSLGAIFPPDENGNIVKAQHISLDTKNSIIYGNKRLISTIGVEDLIIADTQDALLICPKSRAQDVKQMVDMLKDRKMNDYI